MGINVDEKSKQIVITSLNVFADIITEEINKALSYLGEMCVIRIRNRNGYESWFDQTGNLRSSIGYAIFNHARLKIESDFGQILNGTLGKSKGRQLISELSNRYADTYALVVVAGMEYADKVEALENKDVLASTNLWALGEVDSILKSAKDKAMSRIKNIKI